MKFPYKKLTPSISRPIIPVTVSYNNGQEIRIEALIDSGADMCLFGKSVGELMGIPMRTGKYGVVNGISGEKQVHYEHPIAITVGGWKFNIKASFLAKDEIAHPLLGQRGFFELFKIKFDKKNGEVELKEYQ